MNNSFLEQVLYPLIAGIGIFMGSLLANVWFGDGIQTEDVSQAAFIGLLAAIIQWLLNRRR